MKVKREGYRGTNCKNYVTLVDVAGIDQFYGPVAAQVGRTELDLAIQRGNENAIIILIQVEASSDTVSTVAKSSNVGNSVVKIILGTFGEYL